MLALPGTAMLGLILPSDRCGLPTRIRIPLCPSHHFVLTMHSIRGNAVLWVFGIDCRRG